MQLFKVLPFLIQSTFWWVVAKPLVVFFADFKVYGLEHIRGLKAPIIFAPNHSSSLDVVLLPLALPLWSTFSPLFYVSRKADYYTSWKKFIFSFFNLNHIGAYAIEHEKKDYASSLRHHVEIINNGGNMCIFPEGGTTKDGLIRRAHGGVTYLTQVTGAPIVPVLISGTFKLSARKFFTRKIKITIQFFPPMYFQKMIYSNSEETAEEYKAQAERVLNVLRAAKQEPLVTT